ncbi:MFS transporter [Hamadaea tsunoensis]|uniref:MFS transporter n=1 Tax=Hamadaea tsunoensis TaxID=53368 RepID=UPI000428741F|nr:MFS transporter [Hamadaea tsunoensis]
MTTTAPILDQPPVKATSLLRRPMFRRYWTAQSISLFGDQITALALPLLAVLAIHAGPSQMGLLTAAELLPSLLFSLLLGAWVDHRPVKRRLMIVADAGRALLLLTVPALYLLDLLTLTQLYVVAFAVGTFSVLFEVCRNTLFVSLVSPAEFIPANTLLNGSRAMSFVAGPTAGGLLVQLLSAPLALVADALSYVGSALFLRRIDVTEPPPARQRGLGLGTGLRFLVRDPILRPLLLGATTLNLFNYMFGALVILYVTAYLHVSPGVLGVVLGMASAGALIGATVTPWLSRRLGIGRAALLGYFLFPAPLILVPIVSGNGIGSLALLFAAEFVSGFGVMLLDICSGSIQAATIPDDLRARVAGAQRTVNYGIRPLGALIGGFLGTALGVHTTLWISVVGAVAGVLWLLPSPVPAMRTL